MKRQGKSKKRAEGQALIPVGLSTLNAPLSSHLPTTVADSAVYPISTGSHRAITMALLNNGKKRSREEDSDMESPRPSRRRRPESKAPANTAECSHSVSKLAGRTTRSMTAKAKRKV
jgi:hypothetical protein